MDYKKKSMPSRLAITCYPQASWPKLVMQLILGKNIQTKKDFGLTMWLIMYWSIQDIFWNPPAITRTPTSRETYL